MYGLRQDCNMVICDKKVYIMIRGYFIPIPWHIALVFSLLDGKTSINEAVDIVINIGLMSEKHKHKLLSEIRTSYMVFFDDCQFGYIRKDIPKPEEILILSKQKASTALLK